MLSINDPEEADGPDERIESALLLHVLLLHPRPLTEEDLVDELAVDPVDGDQRERVLAAIRALIEAGLLTRHGDRLLPTSAAIRSYELWEG